MIAKILGLLKPMVDKYGTKFLVTLATNAMITYLILQDKATGVHGLIAIVILTVLYYAARLYENKLFRKEG